MYLEHSNIIQIIRTTEQIETHIIKSAEYFIYFIKDADKIANAFLEEIKITDLKTELVIMHIMDHMINYSITDSNVFILAFGKNLLEMTNHIIKKSHQETIYEFIRLFEHWNHRGIYNENLIERCLAILTKKINQIKNTNSTQNSKIKELDKDQDYEKLQKNISLVISSKETKKIFDLRKEHSKIKNQVIKLKKKLEFVLSSNIGKTQKEIQLKEILPKLENEKKNYLNLFLNANELLVEFLN